MSRVQFSSDYARSFNKERRNHPNKNGKQRSDNHRDGVNYKVVKETAVFVILHIKCLLKIVKTFYHVILIKARYFANNLNLTPIVYYSIIHI